MFFSWKSAEQFDHLDAFLVQIYLQYLFLFNSAYRRKKAWNILGKWLQAGGFPSSQHFVIQAKLNFAPLCSAVLSADDRLHKHLSARKGPQVSLAKNAPFCADKASPSCCDGPTHLAKQNFHVPVRSSPSAELEECQESAAKAFHLILAILHGKFLRLLFLQS